MMMRYYIGLAVGHTYAHGIFSSSVDRCVAEGSHQAVQDNEEFECVSSNPNPATMHIAESDPEDSSEDYDDTAMDDWEDDFADRHSGDEEFLAIYEMYNLS